MTETDDSSTSPADADTWDPEHSLLVLAVRYLKRNGDPDPDSSPGSPSPFVAAAERAWCTALVAHRDDQ